MSAFLIIVWLMIAYALVQTLYVEAKQTSWDLLESLIAANILGNVVAIPIAVTLHDSRGYDDWLLSVLIAGLAGTITAAFMAGGAIWTFRRLKIIGETRRWPRIGYMILGLLLFPSMIAIPFNLVLGWIVWVPLNILHTNAEMIRRMQTMLASKLRHEALVKEAQLARDVLLAQQVQQDSEVQKLKMPEPVSLKS